MNILIAGGAGFVGSHITERFARESRDVVVIDGFLPRTAGSRENLAAVADRIQLIDKRVEEVSELDQLAAKADIIIDCMGWTCHRLALADPRYDVELNVNSHLALINALGKASGKRVIHLGSRGQYGNPAVDEITEETPMVPQDIQGINKLACESHWRIFSKVRGLHVLSLRFGNCFGPRQPATGDDIGLIGAFVRDLIEDREVEIYGTGRRRPIISVQDVAEAVYQCAHKPFEGFQAFNLAGTDVVLEELVANLVRIVGHGSFSAREFPSEIKAIDVGNAGFTAHRLASFLGGLPATPLDTSLSGTVRFFQEVIQ